MLFKVLSKTWVILNHLFVFICSIDQRARRALVLKFCFRCWRSSFFRWTCKCLHRARLVDWSINNLILVDWYEGMLIFCINFNLLAAMFGVSNLSSWCVLFKDYLLERCNGTGDLLIGVSCISGRVGRQALFNFVIFLSENIANKLALSEAGHSYLLNWCLVSFSSDRVKAFLKLYVFRTSTDGRKCLFFS